jgi:hypothetical protein
MQAHVNNQCNRDQGKTGHHRVAGVKTHDQHQGDAGKDRYFYN